MITQPIARWFVCFGPHRRLDADQGAVGIQVAELDMDQAATDMRDERTGLVRRAGRQARDDLPTRSIRREDIGRSAGEGEVEDEEDLIGANRLEEAEDGHRREIPPAGLGIAGKRRA